MLSSEPVRNKQEAEREDGHQGADSEQDDQRDTRGEQSAGKVDQPGSDQVAHAFYVAHNARDQDAALGGIMECDRQAPDVGLHLLPKFRDQALCSFRKQLGQRKGSDSLH